MTSTPYAVLAVSLGLCLYAYLGYPAALRLLSLLRARPLRRPARVLDEWSLISIAVPVHNEETVIADTLERILAADYPAARRQILVVSDASTDRTDEIVARFADRGVELLRLPHRAGKTDAENATVPYLRGAIIVNTDASVGIDPGALKLLIAAFADPTVGVASGRDVSVGRHRVEANLGESAYVGYEMWVRDLETRVSGIVGASGCLYAVRADLHRQRLAADLSRDFAAALVAREHGQRAVSVPEAICFVPRGASLRQEYRRKVRTMARGLRTLWAKRALLNPLRYGLFAWMLVSHKLCRWLVPWAALAALSGLAALGTGAPWAWLAYAAATAVGILAVAGWLWPEGKRLPRVFALPAYAVGGLVAGLHAWLRALAGAGTARWEPTRRAPSPGAAAAPHDG